MLGALVSIGKIWTTAKFYIIIGGIWAGTVYGAYQMGKSHGNDECAYQFQDEQIKAVKHKQELDKDAAKAKKKFDDSRKDLPTPPPAKKDVENAMKSLEF